MKINMQVICRKDRVTKDRRAPVFIRFTKNRKVRYISMGVAVRIDDWDFENQCIRSDSPEMQSIQFQIDSKVEDYRRRMRRLEALEVEVTLDNLLETNGRKFNCTVGEYLRQTIRRLKESGKYGSASKHQSLLARLSQFRSPNIRFEEIEFAYLQDFEFFLRKAGNTDNSIATKFAIFKAAYNKALAEGVFVQKVNREIQSRKLVDENTQAGYNERGSAKIGRIGDYVRRTNGLYRACERYFSVLLFYGRHQFHGYGNVTSSGYCTW